MKSIKWQNLLATYTATILVLIALIVLIVYAAPIHVLKDWYISVDKSSYFSDDPIVMKSHSVKLRKAQGHATRILRCGSNLGTTDYTINESSAIRGPGSVNSNRQLKLSSTVASLPAKCRIVIIVHYKVYLIRTITEQTQTKLFEIKPAKIPTTKNIDVTTSAPVSVVPKVSKDVQEQSTAKLFISTSSPTQVSIQENPSPIPSSQTALTPADLPQTSSVILGELPALLNNSIFIPINQ